MTCRRTKFQNSGRSPCWRRATAGSPPGQLIDGWSPGNFPHPTSSCRTGLGRRDHRTARNRQRGGRLRTRKPGGATRRAQFARVGFPGEEIVSNLSENLFPRNRIPNRRNCETFQIEVAGLKYACTISRSSDGRCCELFLNNHKSNSSADNTARDAAIIASIALQHGADVEELRRGLSRDSHGRAMSPVGRCARPNL